MIEYINNLETGYEVREKINNSFDELIALKTQMYRVIKYKGAYDASENKFPEGGGSGEAGKIQTGDMWIISNAGTLGGVAIQPGDMIIAKVDAPGQSIYNWDTINTNIAFTPENVANKVINFGTSNDILYPSVKAVKDRYDGSFNVGSVTPDSSKIRMALTSVGGNITNLDLVLATGSNAGLLSPAKSMQLEAITSGYYTPVISNKSANINTLTVYEADYTKIGNIVTIGMSYTIKVTDSNLAYFNISIPISSNFSSATQANGVVSAYNANPIAGFLRADTTYKNLIIGVGALPVDTNVSIFIQAHYRII